MSKENKLSTSTLIGIFIIALGVLLLLANFDAITINVPDYIFRWQSILIIIGLIIIASSNNRSTGLVLVLIGAIGFIPEFWPVLLILLGAYFLYRTNRHKKTDSKENFEEHESSFSEKDYLNDISIFGGGHKLIQSDNFKGGKVTAIFGGSEIDLLDCKLADGNNYLDVATIFGGTTLIVPVDWKIEIDVVPIFGGFTDKRKREPNQVQDSSKVLIIKGIALFGGGEIKN